MAKIYTVKSNGKVFKVRGPEGATPEQLQTAVQQQASTPAPQPTEEVSEPSFLDRLQQAGDLVRKTSPSGVSEQMFEKIQQGADIAGEKIAELPETFPSVDPNLAGGLGFAVTQAPNLLPAGGGAKLATKGPRFVREVLKRAFTTKGAGAPLGALEKAAGMRSPIPTPENLAAAVGLKGKASINASANKAEELIDAGKGTEIGLTQLKALTKALKAKLQKPGSTPGTELGADLIRVRDKAQLVIDSQVMGRAALRAKYAKAKNRERLLNALGHGAKTVAKTAAIGATAGTLFNLFR